MKYVHLPSVRLLDRMGSDEWIVRHARTSTQGEEGLNRLGKVGGLIGYLMKNRHGSPFEMGAMVFSVKAPLFVWAEHDRHRIGVSQSRESARYREVQPEFYLPHTARTQEGKPGAYSIKDEPRLTRRQQERMMRIAEAAWGEYQDALDDGVAREMARMVLPVNIMMTGHVLFNPRSLMHFLSLRIDSPQATYPTHPQLEIQLVADAYEAYFAQLFPVTHAAFVDSGRVCP